MKKTIAKYKKVCYTTLDSMRVGCANDPLSTADKGFLRC